MNRLFNKRDIILIASLLAAALIAFVLISRTYGSPEGAYCVISYDGRDVKTVDFSQDGRFSLEQNPNVVFEVRNNAIAFAESDCPDKICVHSGFLNRPGQNAACLPNLTALRIVSDSGGDTPDAVAK